MFWLDQFKYTRVIFSIIITANFLYLLFINGPGRGLKLRVPLKSLKKKKPSARFYRKIEVHIDSRRRLSTTVFCICAFLNTPVWPSFDWYGFRVTNNRWRFGCLVWSRIFLYISPTCELGWYTFLDHLPADSHVDYAVCTKFNPDSSILLSEVKNPNWCLPRGREVIFVRMRRYQGNKPTSDWITMGVNDFVGPARMWEISRFRIDDSRSWFPRSWRSQLLVRNVNKRPIQSRPYLCCYWSA